MANKVEVTYNPQLGYLKTVFTHPFDFLTEVQSYSQEQNALELVAGTYQKKTARVRVDLLTETAFRFRMYPYEEKVFENAVFPLEGRQAYSLEDKGECLSLSTGRMELRLQKRPWQLSVLLDGKPLTHENVCDSNVDNMCKYLPIGFDCDGQGNVVKVRETMYMYSDENFYGFGEKFTGFNKRGQVIHCRQSDALSTNTERSYQNIPYFMSSRGYSILLNTYTDNVCDMGVGSGVSYGMEVADKMLDYVMFCDRDYKGLLEGYTALTGRSPMIPKWAFGLWMSKCSYRTQEEVETVARTLREKKIPADVIHIDGWQKMSNSGVWEWDLERFPNPQGMIQTLKDLHFHLSLWMWPYIRVGADSYEFAKEKGYLVMNEKGEVATFHSAATNDFYFAAFDFTNPEMVEWYKGLVKNVVKDGVGVIKTDFSEALPLDAVYYDRLSSDQGGDDSVRLLFSQRYDLYNFKHMDELEAYLLSIVQGICCQAKRESDGDDIIRSIIDYIDRSYQYDITLQELAEKKYFMNASYLSRLFKAKCGKTFSKYLIEYRLEKSRELLEKTILKVSDIAAHVGYNDVSHYIQSFRKVYGVTPEQYRNSLEKPEK